MKGRPSGDSLELFYDFKLLPKESPMRTYYVGMDVHRASIVIVVLNGAGKIVMQSVIETGAERSRFCNFQSSAPQTSYEPCR